MIGRAAAFLDDSPQKQWFFCNIDDFCAVEAQHSLPVLGRLGQNVTPQTRGGS